MRLRPFLKIVPLILGMTLGQELSDSLISSVQDRLAEGAKQSWELGTRCQAILELNVPEFSVFTNTLPPQTSIPSNTTSAIAPVFSIINSVLQPLNLTNPNASQPLIVEGSAGDPASLGVSVLLANWTGQTGENYSIAAKNQLNYLLNTAPKTSDGAISHRSDDVQLWSDFIYMVPPFLAYYGVLSGNQSLIEESYNQIKLYRNYLFDSSVNLWHHILLGPYNDTGHWSTGNAWAAAGMTRVLATIQHSGFSSSFQNEQSDLASWIKEIHTGMYATLDDTNLFTNYADVPISTNGSFYDASSTTLLTASVYRISLLVGDHTFVPKAERSRKTLASSNSSGLTHFTSDGWLMPVVNPEDFAHQGSQSPEGQAFVVEMQAAWQDWVAGGSQGSGAARLGVVTRWQWIGLLLGVVLAVI